MTAADRLDDTFPHGTPEGYKAGCRGGGCPAGAQHGLSCRRAKQLSSGDYQYQKHAKRGATPAEIADALGLSPDTTSQPARKPAGRPTPKEAPMPRKTPTPKDVAPKPAAVVKEKRKSPAGPPQSEVRAWAREHNIPVNPRGTISRDVMERFRAHHADAAGAPTPAGPAASASSAALVAPAADAEPVAHRPVFTGPEHAELNARVKRPDLFAAADDAVEAELMRRGEWPPALPVKDVNAPTTVEVVIDTLIDPDELAVAWQARDTAQASLELALRKWADEQQRRVDVEAALRTIAAHAVALEREAHDDAVHLESMDRALAVVTAQADSLRAENTELRAEIDRLRSPWWKRGAA